METLKEHLSFLLILISLACQGQYLSIRFADSLETKIQERILKLEGPVADSAGVAQRVNKARELLYTSGHLLSSARLSAQDSLFLLTITAGQVFYHSQLELQWPENFAIPISIENEAGLLNEEGLRKFINQQLAYLENHGHPFATLNLIHYQIFGDTLKGRLRLSPGPLVRIDSIAMKGYDSFSPNVLKYDLGLTKGMLYDESLLQKITERTRQIEYLQATRAPAVAFTQSKTVVYLYLEEVKSNQVDGVVGLNTDEDGKTTFTGDFQLRLLNVFKKGEDLHLRWRRPDEAVQELELGLEYPYLFKTPVWLEGNLSIFRQDSSFVNTTVEGLLKYLLESGSFLSGGISYRSSNVLQAAGELPTDYNSFKTTFFKLGLELRKTNRVVVPTKGYLLKTYGLTGKRYSKGNTQQQYGWQVFGDRYFNFAERHIIKGALQSQALFGQNLFQNELFRIGGLKTLRGFNEQSIYSSSYAIGTLEYRYMIGEYDYLTAFADVAYSETKTLNQFGANVFTGLGTGINFRTGAGIFSLFLAVGKDDQNPFDLRTTKVHFGYVNRF